MVQEWILSHFEALLDLLVTFNSSSHEWCCFTVHLQISWVPQAVRVLPGQTGWPQQTDPR
jgi:hypothetical protein